MKINKTLIALMAVVVASAAVIGGVTLTEQYTDYDVNPVGEANAIAATTVVVGAAIFAGGVAVGSAVFGDDDGKTAKELRQIDALETKTKIYDSLLQQAQNNQNLKQVVDNYLKDTKTIARIHGKNAVIKSLNNGTTKITAKGNSNQSIEDYYATKQLNILAQWNTTLTTIDSAEFTERNTTNVSDGFVHGTGSSDFLGYDTYKGLEVNGSTVSVTLVNGSTVQALAIRHTAKATNGETVTSPWTGPTDQTGSWSDLNFDAVIVEPPDTNYNQQKVLNFTKWENQWNEIEQQSKQIESESSTFVDTIYDKYQSGEIQNSDLIDPYLAAKEYSPDKNFGTWALRQYTSMGYQPPNDLGNIWEMNITTPNGAKSGIILSENAPNNGFEKGKTYNASNITGTQYILDRKNGDIEEIKGEFTLDNITTPNGTQKDKVTYTDVNYAATNTTEYQSLMKQLKNTSAEINGWQQQKRESLTGGGALTNWFGGLLPGLNGTQTLIVAILAIVTIGFITRS